MVNTFEITHVIGLHFVEVPCLSDHKPSRPEQVLVVGVRVINFADQEEEQRNQVVPYCFIPMVEMQ